MEISPARYHTSGVNSTCPPHSNLFGVARARPPSPNRRMARASRGILPWAQSQLAWANLKVVGASHSTGASTLRSLTNLISSTLECKLLHIRVGSGTEIQIWKQKEHDDARLRVAVVQKRCECARANEDPC
jgi:hypothetical protein